MCFSEWKVKSGNLCGHPVLPLATQRAFIAAWFCCLTLKYTRESQSPFFQVQGDHYLYSLHLSLQRWGPTQSNNSISETFTEHFLWLGTELWQRISRWKVDEKFYETQMKACVINSPGNLQKDVRLELGRGAVGRSVGRLIFQRRLEYPEERGVERP